MHKLKTSALRIASLGKEELAVHITQTQTLLDEVLKQKEC